MNDEITGAALSPDSGKGESIADDEKFTELLKRYAKQIYSNTSTFAMDDARNNLVAHINAWGRPAAHVSAPTAAPAHLSPDNNGEGCVSLGYFRKNGKLYECLKGKPNDHTLESGWFAVYVAPQGESK